MRTAKRVTASSIGLALIVTATATRAHAEPLGADGLVGLANVIPVALLLATAVLAIGPVLFFRNRLRVASPIIDRKKTNVVTVGALCLFVPICLGSGVLAEEFSRIASLDATGGNVTTIDWTSVSLYSAPALLALVTCVQAVRTLFKLRQR